MVCDSGRKEGIECNGDEGFEEYVRSNMYEPSEKLVVKERIGWSIRAKYVEVV